MQEVSEETLSMHCENIIRRFNIIPNVTLCQHPRFISKQLIFTIYRGKLALSGFDEYIGNI